jgi:hypothetical protein
MIQKRNLGGIFPLISMMKRSGFSRFVQRKCKIQSLSLLLLVSLVQPGQRCHRLAAAERLVG